MPQIDSPKTKVLCFFSVCIGVLLILHPCVLGQAPVFLPAVTYESGGRNLRSVALADVNEDGTPDLITVNAIGGVAMLLNRGDGAFQEAVPLISNHFATSVAVADLNGDLRPDLVLTFWAEGAGGVVLLGNGDGTFQPAISYGFPGNNVSVAVADVNSDRKPDLLVAQCGFLGCSPGDSGAVGVLLGNGDGTFQPVTRYAGGDPNYIAAADLNGDLKPDLVVTNWAHGTVGVLLNRGDGTFQSMETYGSGADVPSSLVTADINGDNKVDLVVANYIDSYNLGSPVGILLGNGDGMFQPVLTYSSGGWERAAIALADVNGDGKLDILVTSGCLLDDNSCEEGNVGILLGNGDGTFQPAVIYSSGGRYPSSVAAEDINGDGRKDIIVANYGSGDVSGVVGVLLNATSICTTPPTITLSTIPSSLWPPTHKMVPVTVSGTITDIGCSVTKADYAVTDEYRAVQPTGPVTVGPQGDYSFTVLLQASRLGTDLDGRRYTITVRASNNAGRTGSQSYVVIVPHDQGH